jgi:hypothetical protein
MGRGQFRPQGFDLNKRDRHSLEDVPCQISKLYLSGFFKKRYFKFFLLVAMATTGLHEIKIFEQFL